MCTTRYLARVFILLPLLVVFSACDGDPVTVPDEITSRVIHVPGDAATISDAADLALSGEQILVAPGVYPEHGIVLRRGVSLRGASGQASDVVIDGQGLGRVLEVVRSDSTIVIENLFVTNGFTAESGGAGLLLQSPATIRNCRFLTNRSSGSGAGVRVDQVRAQFVNCAFDSNSGVTLYGSGAGMSVGPTDLFPVELDSCSFTGNVAEGHGGGLKAEGSIRVTNTTFLGNRGRYGGGLDHSGGMFADCVFRGNRAIEPTTYNTPGGGGGAFMVFGGEATTFERCLFESNEADNKGGAGSVGDAKPVTMNFCTFVGNTARQAGAIFAHNRYTDNSIMLNDCTVTGNSATDNCGAVFISHRTDLIATNTAFAENTAPQDPGCLIDSYCHALFICCDVVEQEVTGSGTFAFENQGCDNGVTK